MALEVSVVIPARDEADSIATCLTALTRQTVGAGALEVIVVAAGEDGTAGAAQRASADAGFGRFEIVHLGDGNKNVALLVGCARSSTPVIVMLDADTELAADAIAELMRTVREGPERAVHGAALPRYDTWVSRYWELNRQLVKDLRFDAMLSGEFLAMQRATILRIGGDVLFPELRGVKGDFYLARVLAARGCAIGYVPSARGVTLTPWTFRGLARTMLRSRRGSLAITSRADALAQGALSAVVVGGVPAALLVMPWSRPLAAACVVPLLVYVARLVSRVEALRRRGIGDHRRELPSFLFLDLLGRAIKVWALAERLGGGKPPHSFRGERPGEVRVPGSVRRPV